MLLPALAEHLTAHAPLLRVHLVDLVPDDRVGTLESHDVDFALLPETPLPDWAEGQPVFSSSFFVIARKAHPRTTELAPGDVMPLDLFCDLGHVLFSTEGKPKGLGDEALARIGRERSVAMTLPVFSGERWSWFFDQFYAAQRSGMVFISRGKFCVWFSISINLVRGHQTVG